MKLSVFFLFLLLFFSHAIFWWRHRSWLKVLSEFSKLPVHLFKISSLNNSRLVLPIETTFTLWKRERVRERVYSVQCVSCALFRVYIVLSVFVYKRWYFLMNGKEFTFTLKVNKQVQICIACYYYYYMYYSLSLYSLSLSLTDLVHCCTFLSNSLLLCISLLTTSSCSSELFN